MTYTIVAGASGRIGRGLMERIVEKNLSKIIAVDIEPLDRSFRESLHLELIEFVGDLKQKTFSDSIAKEIIDKKYDVTGVVNLLAYPERMYLSDKMQKMKSATDIESHKELAREAFSEYKQELFEETFITNVIAFHNLIQSCMPVLINSKSVSIVSVSSQYALRSPDQTLFLSLDQFNYKPPAYSVSKAGLNAYILYLAELFAGTNVRSNSCSIGSVQNGQNESFLRAYGERTHVGRMMNSAEAIDVIQFLLSDASRYMSGSNLVADGGWSQA